MRKTGVYLLVILVLLAIILLLPSGGEYDQGPSPRLRDAAERSDDQLLLRQLSRASQRLANKVGPAVVRIQTRNSATTLTADDELMQLFGHSYREYTRKEGSGVVVSEDGYVLTNYHIAVNAESIRVILDSDQVYDGELVGADGLTDLVLLKIDATELESIEWGDSESLQVGEFVWAIGNPFGLERSISFGILSAKNRESITDNYLHDFLQTDAAVNPGNSGGPLIDAQGRVIGINTAIIGRSYMGISFAIPSNTAREVCDRLKTTGKLARGWLGITLDVVTSEHARRVGLSEAFGAYVAIVDQGANSPAKRAGIRTGDVIVRWRGQRVESPIALSRMVAQAKPGSQAKATVMRDREEQSVSITLGERP